MAGVRPFTDQEISAMEGACSGRYRVRDQLIVQLFNRTGYRVGELRSLTVGDIWDGSQVRARIRVKARHMKNGIARDPVPLRTDMKPLIVRWLMTLQASGRLHPDTPLLLSRKSKGTPRALSREHIWYLVKTLAEFVGAVARIGTHSFRKALAVRVWHLSEYNLEKCRRVLGHRQISSTQHYIESAVSDADIEALFLA
jgi:integrase